MPGHEYFQELSSLAMLGDLSTEESSALAQHLRGCTSCRAVYLEFTELTHQHLPLADRYPGRSFAPASNKVREATLQRAAAEGLRISPEALRGPIGFRKRINKGLDDLRWTLHARAMHLALSVAVLSMVIVGGIEVRHDMERAGEIQKLRSDLSRTQSEAAQLHQQLGQVTQTQFRTTADTEHLQQQLGNTATQMAQLDAQRQQDFATIHSLEERIAHLTSDKNALAQRAEGSEEELAKLNAQLQQARAAATDKEAQLVAFQYQITDLSSQLKAQQSALDRERQLLTAGRDIRDLMGARNLHIIDVHDMDAHGEARPFGRIFLTEGKQLIFYAYDLNSAKVHDASFQAWAQRGEDARDAVNLGILYMDDQKQSRWALKVDDPNLLKALDSVFVTVEPRGGVDKPTGKKLMYAYLRNPINHP